MKRVIGLLCMFTLAILLPLAAMAGDYHRGAALVCADCHTMHFSQQHGYGSGASSGFPGGFTPLGTGPNEYLLRNPVNTLCLQCHDGQTFAPDVLGANTNTYIRLAGALNRTSDAAAVQQTGHTLGETAAAPGSNPSWSNASGLSCANCHDPHGTDSYRNLALSPGNYGAAADTVIVSYNAGPAPNYAGSIAKDLTKAVYQVDGTLGQLATHYAWANVQYNEPSAAQYNESAYAFFCKGCHTEFHGAVGGGEVGGVPITGGYEEWLRHPSAVANIGALGGGHSSYSRYSGLTNKVKTMSASGVYPATDNTPSCFSCHKSHGNGNAFGLIYMSGSGGLTEEGDTGTTVKELCRNCHSQGG